MAVANSSRFQAMGAIQTSLEGCLNAHTQYSLAKEPPDLVFWYETYMHMSRRGVGPWLLEMIQIQHAISLRTKPIQHVSEVEIYRL